MKHAVRDEARSIEVIARAVIEDQGRLLLCQNKKQGYLYLPGGHVEAGESAAEAAVRELAEECGVEISGLEPVAISEERFEQRGIPRHELNLVFHVKHARDGAGPLKHTRPVQSLEHDISFRWIARQHLSQEDIRPSSLARWLLDDPSPTVSWVSSEQSV
ncbi:MAG: NUDIX domain-containing protein [Planctomycetota bacterium]